MKLNKETKTKVKAGDVLRFSDGSTYTVLGVVSGSPSAVSFTIRDNADKRTIYAYPSSKMYGAEIIPSGDC